MAVMTPDDLVAMLVRIKAKEQTTSLVERKFIVDAAGKTEVQTLITQAT